MAVEIERKFLVVSDAWKAQASATRALVQFYLSAGDRSNVRIRLEGTLRAWLTIKGASAGRSRPEFEYEIPVQDARQMMALADGAIIKKVRHLVPWGEVVWEIDVFGGENDGLVIAEIELTHGDQPLELPPWIGPEVTADRRYYNASLARQPMGRGKAA